jgi:hypothetical protein
MLFAIVAVIVTHASAQVALGASQERASCIVGADGKAVCGYACIAGADGRAVCAQAPGGACLQGADGHVVCSAPPARSAPLQLAERAAQCVRGANGRVACGFACATGADGVARCAATSDGACLQGSDGHVVCTQLDANDRIVVLTHRPQRECKRTADGGVVCGYACLTGADGRGACANTPDGACAQGTDGRVVCTELDASRRVFLGDAPASECVKGADGRAVCGYGCARGSDGRARCSSDPFGICATGADGRARCFPE